MEKGKRLIFCWETNAPVCQLEKDEEGRLRVSLFRRADYELPVGPDAHMQGLYSKVLVFSPPPPPAPGPPQPGGGDLMLPVPAELDMETGQLGSHVKFVIHMPKDSTETPIRLDTVLVDTMIHRDEKDIKERGAKKRITKHV